MKTPVCKTLLVLANSIKKFPSRCVAGIELIERNDTYEFGGWVRPIDPTQDEGAIPLETTRVDGVPVVPLQVVKMWFSGPSNDPYHREDWILAPKLKWKSVGEYNHHDIFDSLPDELGDLWGPASAHTRRIPAQTGRRTLRLIKPSGPVFVTLCKEFNPFKNKDTLKKTLHVQCCGVEHLLSITDPVFEQRHGIHPSKVNSAEVQRIDLNAEGLIIVASLTPPFNGEQYKIAAAIIEP